MKIQVAIKHGIKIVLILAVCLIIWLAGNVSGIRYQQSKIKHPTGNGVAFLYELNGEQELTLNDLKEGQAIACIFLVEKGSVEAWIETESGDRMTSIMNIDRNDSYMFSVPSAGDYIIRITGKDASVYVSTLMYDKTE